MREIDFYLDVGIGAIMFIIKNQHLISDVNYAGLDIKPMVVYTGVFTGNLNLVEYKEKKIGNGNS